MRPIPFGVAWILQGEGLPNLAINLQSALEVCTRSQTKIPLFEWPTRYRPPGTMKRLAVDVDMTGCSIFLVVLGHIFATESLRCFSYATQSSIHLRGPIVACSSFTSVISGMRKLGRKRALSRHTRRRASTHTTRCRVGSWKALQVLITSGGWLCTILQISVPEDKFGGDRSFQALQLFFFSFFQRTCSTSSLSTKTHPKAA